MSESGSLGGARNLAQQDAIPVLRTALRSRRIGDVIQAADLVRVGELRELAPDLIEAYERLSANPTKLDPSCSAMEAIVRALDAFEEPAREVYAHAVKHVQMSPLLDEDMETLDLAAGMRRQAILAMVRTGDPQALEAATDLLADSKTVARAGAANALRVIGSEAAVLLLRYCVKAGERKAEVLTECFAGMLDYSAANLDLVTEYALDDDEVIASIAALAIADARPAGALDVLRGALAAHRNPDLRDVLLSAIAGLRSDEAVAFLIEMVGRDSVTAISALTALHPYGADRGVVARIQAEAKSNKRPEVLATFRRHFQ